MFPSIKRENDMSFESHVILLKETKLWAIRQAGLFNDIVVQARSSVGSTDNDAGSWVDFPAHKVVLVAASPYFYSLHDEGRLTDVVRLPDSINADAFSLLLDVLYGAPLTMTDVRSRSETSEFIDRLINVALVFDLGHVADRLRLWSDEYNSDPSGSFSASKWEEEEEEEHEDDDDAENDGSMDDSHDENYDFVDEMLGDSRGDSTDDVSLVKDLQPEMNFESGVTLSNDLDPTRDGDANGNGDNSFTDDFILSSSNSCSDFNNIERPAMKKTAMKKSKAKQRDVSDEDLPFYDLSTLVSSSLNDSNANNSQLPDQYKPLSQKDVEALFKNPRDRALIGKKRIRNNIDKVTGTMNSWRRASKCWGSFIGKSVAYGNRTSRSKQVLNDVKMIKGEIRGDWVGKGNRLELRLPNDVVKSDIIFKRTPTHCWCPFCKLQVASGKGNRLAYHLFADHDFIWLDLAMVCDLCDHVIFTEVDMEHHLSEFHGVMGEAHVCHKCGKTYASELKLRRHKENCAADPSKKSDERPHKVYPGKSFDCETCRKSFKSAIVLENHMCKEHGAAYRFSCTQRDCTFGTNVRSFFSEHLFNSHKINVGEKPILKCSYCDYFTSAKQLLKRHELTHTATEYNFKCNEEGCGKAFRQLRHLRDHVGACHVDMKLPCQRCGAIFGSSAKLRRHEKIMHTERVRNFKCGYCSHATVARENCRTHVKRSHQGLPVTVIDLRKSGMAPLPL